MAQHRDMKRMVKRPRNTTRDSRGDGMGTRADAGEMRNMSFIDSEKRTEDMSRPGMKNARTGINVRAKPCHMRTASGRMCSGERRKSGLGCTGR